MTANLTGFPPILPPAGTSCFGKERGWEKRSNFEANFYFQWLLSFVRRNKKTWAFNWRPTIWKEGKAEFLPGLTHFSVESVITSMISNCSLFFDLVSQFCVRLLKLPWNGFQPPCVNPLSNPHISEHILQGISSHLTYSSVRARIIAHFTLPPGWTCCVSYITIHHDSRNVSKYA